MSVEYTELDAAQLAALEADAEMYVDRLLGVLAANSVDGESMAQTLHRERHRFADGIVDEIDAAIDAGMDPQEAAWASMASLCTLLIAAGLRLNRLDPA